MSSNGHVEITIMVNGRCVRYPLCRVIWINFNGPIPAGSVVTHCDSDKLNNSLHNLQVEVYKRKENYIWTGRIRYGN